MSVYVLLREGGYNFGLVAYAQEEGCELAELTYTRLVPIVPKVKGTPLPEITARFTVFFWGIKNISI